MKVEHEIRIKDLIGKMKRLISWGIYKQIGLPNPEMTDEEAKILANEICRNASEIQDDIKKGLTTPGPAPGIPAINVMNMNFSKYQA